ncbi:MAG: hypothetical protein RI934_1035 [Bacteroidota bacterium]|jgi:hypothetical protein
MAYSHKKRSFIAHFNAELELSTSYSQAMFINEHGRNSIQAEKLLVDKKYA